MTKLKSERPSADPDKMPINYHEDYRRARRNSLWWSAITILTMTALGGHPNDGFKLASTDLTLSSAVVWNALFLTTIFMLAGFVRAYRALRVRHSKGLFRPADSDTQDDIHDLIAMIDRYKESIANAETKIPKVVTKREEYRDQLQSLIGKFQDGMSNISQSISSAESNISYNLQEIKKERENDVRLITDIRKFESLNDAKKQDVLTKVVATSPLIKGVLDDAKNEVNNALDKYNQLVKELDLSNLESLSEKLAECEVDFKSDISDISQFKNDIHDFHKQINEEDKMWVKVYDLTPVIGLFSLSLIALSWKLTYFFSYSPIPFYISFPILPILFR